MRLWLTIPIIVSFFCGSGLAFGQTATPHPNALPVGGYVFTELSSPDIELGGTGWGIRSQTGQTRLHTLTDGDTLTFYVEDNADYLMIFGDGFTSNSYWDICVDATCQTINDRNDTGGDKTVLVHLLGTNSEVVITKNGGNRTQFQYMQIILDPDSITAVSGTGGGVSPTATPEPYYIYGTISGVSGTVSTRFDMVVTAGDVAISNALIFLFFSLWAIFIIYILRRDNV